MRKLTETGNNLDYNNLYNMFIKNYKKNYVSNCSKFNKEKKI